jgi:hypothetical protein
MKWIGPYTINDLFDGMAKGTLPSPPLKDAAYLVSERRWTKRPSPSCHPLYVGGNTGIEAAAGSLIAVTDAGCRLDPRWLEYIVAPLEADASAEVASGYYAPDARTLLEQAVAAATVRTAGEEDPQTFLPSSRSVAFRKETWRSARITAFGSTRHAKHKPADDPNLAALVESGAPVLIVFGKSWDYHVTHALRVTLAVNLDLIRSSLAFLKGRCQELLYDAEHFFDGYRSDPDYALKTLQAAVAQGLAQFQPDHCRGFLCHAQYADNVIRRNCERDVQQSLDQVRQIGRAHV